MATHLIYSSSRSKNIPIGLVIGDIFQSPTMSSINPLANSVQLRLIQKEDSNHDHVMRLEKSERCMTIKVNGPFDVGSLMGFSGEQCFHFSMKTWIILYVLPQVIADGNEKIAYKNQTQINMIAKGDIRLVVDQGICNIYLLRGKLYENGKLCAQNNQLSLSLNMVEFNRMSECNWFNMPSSNGKESLVPLIVKHGDIRSCSDNNNDQSRLLFIGILKKEREEVIASIIGTIYRAPIEPYRFGKSKFVFELIYINGFDQYNEEQMKMVEHSQSLITIKPRDEACTSIYSTSGHGFTICYPSIVHINGQLLIVDSKDGSLIRHLNTSRHQIDHLFGNLKVYVCDENIIVLDNKTNCFQIDKI